MAKQLTATATLTTVDDVTGEQSSESWTDTFTYTQKVCFEKVYSGAVADDPVDFGTINSAKAVFIEVGGGQSAVDVKFNGNATPIAINDGDGGYMWVNRNGGITQMNVTTTAAATVKVVVFA